ncbi:Isochorismate hydrolase [Streptoalloteichus tenebrarius]|uniref:Isochorismate hydrolase n=1 Tax=Streptoalloteichus tenebrarius (strain ATCC 17920 / DSM 40477 / JCM 4838 / CBS 697.72 / NBRC 16177 / NCIMB 11028 / NRRL B-12390 / A12253. 1 / ISP 5477) TaxID=1933 RepID=A0ABT1I082_STRSD|nr:isochorismatase family protein [Streptoalloteichus tenebrarius]MCP2261202.1 Isochorismate hydrolase [Streptoalloteichus tenebrarius]BFF02936.1 hypothetical protein GCM10020241_46110 [Streptoalloteichus tenebrarius]
MAIPAIPSYPMPTEADLPANRVSWEVDPERAVLLVHDMQRYFVRPFEDGASPITELVANIRALRAACAETGVPVVFSAQPGGQTPRQRGLLQDYWGDGIPGGLGEERIVDDLAPGDDDVVLTKWRYSAFVRTDLRERMREWGRDQLVVTGIYAHIGVLMTAADAFMNDCQTFVVADAVADFSVEHHRMAVEYAAQRCAVVTTTERAATWLAAPRAAKAG